MASQSINPISGLASSIEAATQKLQESVTALQGKTDITSQDLLLVQDNLQKQGLIVQLQAQLVKTMGDMLKDIVQKM